MIIHLLGKTTLVIVKIKNTNNTVFMINFSQREQYLNNLPKHEEKVLQSKIPLWNFLYGVILSKLPKKSWRTIWNVSDQHFTELANILEMPVTDMGTKDNPSIKNLEERFLSIETKNWFTLFDVIEWCYKVAKYNCNWNILVRNVRYVEKLNKVFEDENISYRMLDNGRITSIDEKIERKEIEKVFAHHENIANVKSHISKAWELLDKRPNPDFSNAIKEAISAVEALCALIVFTVEESRKPRSLGAALEIIQNKSDIEIHHYQLKAFKMMYKYTSDANGIRHAAMNDLNLDREDAIYMIVICSSFVNYLLAKADKAGISL